MLIVPPCQLKPLAISPTANRRSYRLPLMSLFDFLSNEVASSTTGMAVEDDGLNDAL